MPSYAYPSCDYPTYPDTNRSLEMATHRPSFTAAAMMLTLITHGLFGVSSAMAEDENTDANKWQFEITPYLFAASMDGTASMRGITADVDMSFNDIWERLDSAFMLYMTARKNEWIYSFDAVYFKLTDQGSRSWQGPLGNTSTAQLNMDVTQEIYSFSGGRRVLNERTKVDVLGVARYTGLDPNLSLAVTTGPALLPDGSRSVSRSESWWDAAIAVSVSTPISSKWDLTGYADIGGGGSDLTYQLLAGLNWQFSRVVSAKFGYRYFYQDYQKDDFKWDMTNSGAYLGVGFRF
jgi:hypothetical protein